MLIFSVRLSFRVQIFHLLDMKDNQNRLRMDVGAAQQKVLVLDDLKYRRQSLEAEREGLTAARQPFSPHRRPLWIEEHKHSYKSPSYIEIEVQKMKRKA